MCKNWFKVLFVLVASIMLAACGGGGGGGATPGVAAKATVSGTVTIPALSNMVAKRVSLLGSSSFEVEVYTLDGKLVKRGQPIDIKADQSTYSYFVADLPPGVDYVIKANLRGTTFRKLIAKGSFTKDIQGQNIDAVSTTAVLIASKKLDAPLGDSLPANKTISALSTAIDADIKPVLLEGTIAAAVNGGKSNLTATTAGYANLFNVVVTAAVEGKEPGTDLTGTVPRITVADGAVTVTNTTVTAAGTTTLIANAATNYTAPADTAATYNGFARKYLSVQDISNAYLNYEKALSIDSTDKEANFGGAITGGMMLMEDTQVKDIVAKWGAVLPTVNQVVQGTSPMKLPFGNMTSVGSSIGGGSGFKLTAKTVASTSSAQDVLAAFKALQGKLPRQKAGFKSLAKELGMVPATAPTVSEMQTVIDNVIIPRIDTILARLAKVEGKGYSFTVTAAMQGNPTYGRDVVLNDGEFYTLDAALNIFQILFKVATAYNFDLPAGYTYNTIGQDPLAMINSSTVFTLKSGGAAKMAGALDNAKSAAAKAASAFTAVKDRVAGTGVVDISGWTAAQKTDFKTTLDKITVALTGQTTLTISGKAIAINITKFFTNPLTRANLPAFGYDVPRDAALSAKYNSAVAAERSYTDWNGVARTYPIGCGIVPTSDLPDYTLNGILPGNSAANNVAGFNGILPVLGGKVLSASVGWSRFTTDGTAIYYLENVSSSQTTNNYRIKKIDPSTGVVTTHLNVSTTFWAYLLVYHNGKFYLAEWKNDSVVFYEVAANGSVGATTAFSLPSANGKSFSAFTSSGTDIYYVLVSWGYTPVAEIHKLSGIGGTDSILFTVPDDVLEIAYSNNTFYLNMNGDFDLGKWTATGALQARYATPGTGWILVGGYFYGIGADKIIKYAGTPAGGAAKLANSF